MPTQQEEIDALTNDVFVLKLMLGTKFLNMSSEQLEAELKPENELPGGRYPYMLSDYQLHKAVDHINDVEIPRLDGRIDAVDSAPVNTVDSDSRTVDSVNSIVDSNP